jgi:hypothetical protein
MASVDRGVSQIMKGTREVLRERGITRLEIGETVAEIKPPSGDADNSNQADQLDASPAGPTGPSRLVTSYNIDPASTPFSAHELRDLETCVSEEYASSWVVDRLLTWYSQE